MEFDKSYVLELINKNEYLYELCSDLIVYIKNNYEEEFDIDDFIIYCKGVKNYEK